MRLGVITPYAPLLSGIGQYGSHLTRALVDSGQFGSVVILANRADGAPLIEQTGIQTIRRVWPSDDPRVLAVLCKEIRQARADTLWFNLGFSIFGAHRLANFAGLLTPLWARYAGYRIVITLHALIEAVDLARIGMHAHRLNPWGARLVTHLLLAAAHAVVVTTRVNQNLLQERYRARHVHLIPLPAYYSPGQLVEPNGHREILMFTTHAPYKGLSLLLDAFREIQCRHPESHLTIAGSDHPRFPGYLRRMQETLGPIPGVFWLGALAEERVPDVLAQSSVLVLPYRATTGASSVLPQACALGLPVVASDLPDLRAAAAEENLHVEFFEPNNRGHLVQVLNTLLFDPARQLEIGRHNANVIQRWNLQHTSQRYVQLLTSA